MHLLTFAEVLSICIIGLFLQLIVPFIHGCIQKSRRSEKYRQRKSRTRAIFSADVALERGFVTHDGQDDEDIFSSDVSFCRLLSLHSYLWMFVWIPTLVIGILRISTNPDDTALALVCCSSIGLGLGLLVVLSESCCSWESQYIEGMLGDTSCISYLNSLRKVKPSIMFTIECYHYEKRYRTVMSHDQDGKSSSTTESYQVKVVDRVDTEAFHFDRWEDISMSPEKLTFDPRKITRVRIVKMIRFGDKITADRFKQQKQYFYNHIASKGNWEHMDMTEKEEVVGYMPRIACYWNGENESCWMNTTCYWIFTLICCTWFYRLAFNKATQKTSYKLQKLVFTDKIKMPEWV